MRVVVLTLLAACDYVSPVPRGDVGASDADASAADCAALEPADFRDHVLVPILENQGCIVCHRPGGRASGSDLVLLGGDDEQVVATDLASAITVAAKHVDGESVLLLRPTDRFPGGHPGGAGITLGSPEYLALERFVRAVEGCPAGESGPSGHAPVGPARP